VEAYVKFQRDSGKKGGSIRVDTGCITSLCKECRHEGESPAKAPDVRDLIRKYEEDDGTKTTAAFDFLTDLPKIWAACWSAPWDSSTSLMVWCMFLIAICLMARASDVTQFCPLYEDMKLPPAPLWGADGLPGWIDIGLW